MDRMKTVLITGAHGNLGGAVVSAFLQEGYNVAAVDARARDEDSSRERYSAYQADLKNEAEGERVVQKIIEDHGTIDAAILLAGGFAMGGIMDTASRAIQDLIDLNFFTSYNIARPVLNHMLSKGTGRIVLTGARPGLQPESSASMVAYTLSKSLVFRLAELMNAETKGTDVVTSVIVPGTIDTPQNRKSMPDADPSSWATPESIAEVLKFICGETASILRQPIYKVYNKS